MTYSTHISSLILSFILFSYLHASDSISHSFEYVRPLLAHNGVYDIGHATLHAGPSLPATTVETEILTMFSYVHVV